MLGSRVQLAPLVLVALVAAPARAQVDVDKSLAPGQDPTPAPGSPVAFDVTIRNDGAGTVTVDLADVLDPCFAPLASCAQVTCSGGTGCGTCALTPMGFTVTGSALAARGQPGSSLAFRIAAFAGPAPGACTNTARATERGTGAQVSDSVTVAIGGAGIEATKALGPRQPGTVPPGSPVEFVVTVRNLSSQPVSSGELVDTLDPCFSLPVSCAAVACSGGTSCGTCAPTATGFRLSGVGLAPAGQAGDALQVVMTVPAGSSASGTCTNRVVATDPATGDAASASAAVTIAGTPPALSIVKRLAAGQPPDPAPGAPVVFEVIVRNTGAVPAGPLAVTDLPGSCFLPVSSCAQVSCSGAASCGTCALIPGGFTQSGLSLAPAGQGGDAATLTVALVAGSAAGMCANRADTTDPASGTPLSATASVVIQPATGVTVAKTLARGQGATPAPGEPVRFEIAIANPTAAAISGITIADVLDACFEAVSCADVTCGAGPPCGTCAVTATGFAIAGASLAAAGQPLDRLVYEVAAVAGSSPGTCRNTATVSHPGGSATSAATVSIQATGCPLLAGDVSFPAGGPGVNWPRIPPWVYLAPCATGSDPILAVTIASAAVPGDLGDAFAGPGASLRLFQVGCGAACPTRIGLAKNGATGRVALAFLP